MRTHRLRVILGAIAFSAVTIVLSNLQVDADVIGDPGGKGGNGNNKGIGSQVDLQACPATCSDVCDPTVDPEFHVCSNNNGWKGTFGATFACCCCGDAPLGKYYGGSPK